MAAADITGLLLRGEKAPDRYRRQRCEGNLRLIN
jgi:hypothetical protein